MVDHWGIDDRLSARTAFPITLYSFIPIILPDGTSVDQGLSLTGKPIYIYGAQCNSTYATDFGNVLPCPGGRAINPDAFAYPSCPSSNPNCYGNAPRNFARGFGAWQMNLAIRREFPIHERLKLQFRAEAFNIFNHTNLGGIDPNFGSSTFGQATSTLAHSWDSGSVLSSLYQMGGARSSQFALKLVF
jgi:hypothetical protein